MHAGLNKDEWGKTKSVKLRPFEFVPNLHPSLIFSMISNTSWEKHSFHILWLLQELMLTHEAHSSIALIVLNPSSLASVFSYRWRVSFSVVHKQQVTNQLWFEERDAVIFSSREWKLWKLRNAWNIENHLFMFETWFFFQPSKIFFQLHNKSLYYFK